jgi:predicted  nucleic acid-binding Zn-ribbon protein
MSIAKQLYQLQEVELEIETNEQALKQIASQLGENQVVVRVQTKLAQEQQSLDELRRQQHSAEWEIDDITTKLRTAEEELYSGRIRNPKELTSLQHEVEGLKAKRGQLEDKALEIMDQVEHAEASVATISGELKTVEAEWQSQQQQLSTDMERLKTILADLKQKQQLNSAKIDHQAVQFYGELKKQKGQAVAKVEQGICRGCRISLPTAELQRARSGNLVQCGSCGRLLFLA